MAKMGGGMKSGKPGPTTTSKPPGVSKPSGGSGKMGGGKPAGGKGGAKSC